MFNIYKVDHIGIAVKNLDEVIALYQDALGLHVHGIETVPEQKAKVAFVPCGETELEFLEPTDSDGPIGKFLAKNGDGIHHIALGVDNIEAALEDLKAKGVRLIDEKPRTGAGGAKIAFLHPKGTYGVLLEISEHHK